MALGDGVSATTGGANTVHAGIISRGSSAITTEAEAFAITGGNGIGTASDAYPATGAVGNTCRGVFEVANGDGVSATRTSVADTADPAEKTSVGSFVDRYAVESRPQNRSPRCP